MRKITRISGAAMQSVRRKRTGAYVRVSSGKDAMLHSLSAQISYYNRYIQRRGDWEFAGIYADEAITGTKDARPEFQRMLADCRAGKIDMVITKSLTRFARNTVTLLETVRELKLLGIDVFFERENIHTLSADGEFMLTLLASYAQEESRSASENQKWKIRKMFEQGRPNTGRMLGYRLRDGQLRIIPEEADIVRRIFAEYLSGMGKLAITKNLIAEGIPTLNGGTWRTTTIMSILQNEKYIGNMLLQKTFRPDHISKKTHINRGEMPMYEVIDSHEPIIDKAIFETVQRRIAEQAARHHPSKETPARYPFTEFIECGICGKHYRRKIANASSRYAKPVWICSTFNTYGKDACPSQQIPENVLMAKTMEALELSEWDESVMKQRVAAIRIPGHNRLIYDFTDGQSVEVHWQNPSRRESWTDAMREEARIKQLDILEERGQK